jgi:two-component system OmpR family response regulator
VSHILIVDDASDILELASIGLEIAGHSFATASNSAEALQALQGQPPDLILLDYQLGAESGLDVLKQIQAVCQIPVVFLTAATEAQPFLDAGAAGVINKPFDPMALGAQVAPWLAG